MKLHSLLLSAPKRLRRFRFIRSTGGIAAVEFAMIVPVMLLMYIGIVDVTRGVIASRKLDILSRTLSDLVSQQTSGTISNTQLATMFSAATTLMQPFTTNGLTMTVSEVVIQAKSNGTCCDALVKWSYTQNGTQRACTTPLLQVANGVAPATGNIPAALITANANAGYGYTNGKISYLIITDTHYTYVPIFNQALSWFSSGMNKTTFMVPRSASNPVTLTSAAGVVAGQSGTICP